MSINVNVHGNTNPLVRDVDAAVKRINRSGGIKIQVDDKGVTQPLGNMRRSADEFTKSLEASNARVLAFGASVGIINAVSNAFKGLVEQTIKVEKNLTDINVVMGLTTKQLDKFGSGLFKVAAETGAGFQAASEAATEFARQGLSVTETLRRTKDALVLTRLTGMKSTEAVKSLTAAMNTFKGEVKDSTQLVSKFAAVDVKFAVSAQDFADAIARAGASARDAGVDINQLIGLVTAAQERTARGGAVIGNSFKTIFTRVRRSSTLQELENLGVAVRDLQGKTLPAMKILQDLANRYDSLTDSQRSYISQNVAGVFQINILKAAMADLGKANSVTAQATAIAAAATDESSKKNEQLRQTMAALAGETGVAIQNLAKNIGDIALAPGISKVLDGIKGLADGANNLLGDGDKEGSRFAKGLLAGMGNFISGPGLVIITAVISKLFVNAMKYGMQSLSSLLNINKAANQRKSIEQNLMMVLAQHASLQKEMLRTDISRADKEKIILTIMKQQTLEAGKLSSITKMMTPSLMRQGVGPNLSVRGRADGFVPNYAIEDDERRAAIRGGYAPGGIKQTNIPGMGPVTYNAAEDVKKFPGMSQPAIVPPQGSRAARAYDQEFMGAHGFSPYGSGGYVPNYALSNAKFASRINGGKMDLATAVSKGYTGSLASPALIAKYNKQNAGARQSANKNQFAKKSALAAMLVPPEGYTSGGSVTYPSRGKNFKAGKGRTWPVYKLRPKGGNPAVEGKLKDGVMNHINSLGSKYTASISRSLGARDTSGSTKAFKTAWKSDTAGGAKGAVGSAVGAIFEASVNGALKYSAKGRHENQGDFDVRGGEFEKIKEAFSIPGGVLKQNLADYKANDSSAESRESFWKKLMKEERYMGTAQQNLKSTRGLGRAFGFIPNYADPLGDAIAREKGAGIPVSQIRVGSHDALVGKSNPGGLGVTNTRDEPRGLKDVFGANGLVPNFALGGARDFVFGPNIDKLQEAVDKGARILGHQNNQIEQHIQKEDAAAQKLDELKDSRQKLKEANEKAKKEVSDIKKDRDQETDPAKRRQKTNDLKNANRRQVTARKQQTDATVAVTQGEKDLKQRTKKLESARRHADTQTKKVAQSERSLHAGQQKKDARSQRMQMGGMAAMMGASMLAGQLQQSDSQTAKSAGGALQGASTGAAMGMMFGPWGIAIGAAAGALQGFTGAVDKAKKELAKIEIERAVKFEAETSAKLTASMGSAFSSPKFQALLNKSIGSDSPLLKETKVSGRDVGLSTLQLNSFINEAISDKDKKKMFGSSGGVDSSLNRARGNMERSSGAFLAEGVIDALRILNSPAEGTADGSMRIQGSFGSEGYDALVANMELKDALEKTDVGTSLLNQLETAFKDQKVVKAFGAFGFEPAKESSVSGFEDSKTGSEYGLLGIISRLSSGEAPIAGGGFSKYDMNKEEADNLQTIKNAYENIISNMAKDLKIEVGSLQVGGDMVFEGMKSIVDELGMFEKDLSKLNTSQVLHALSSAYGVEMSQADGPDNKKLNQIKAGMSMAIDGFVDSMDSSTSIQVMFNGQLLTVDKALLRSLRKQAKDQNNIAKLNTALANSVSSRAIESNKQLAMARKQLSIQEIMLRFQTQMISKQFELNDTITKVTGAYKVMAAGLGAGASREFKISRAYESGSSKASSTKKLAIAKADDKLKAGLLKSLMNPVDEQWSGLGPLIENSGFLGGTKLGNAGQEGYQLNVEKALKDISASEGGAAKLDSLLQTRDNETSVSLKETQARGQLHQARANEVNAAKNAYSIKLNELGFTKQAAQIEANRVRKMEHMARLQETLNMAIEREIQAKEVSFNNMQIQTRIARGAGAVSSSDAYSRSAFDSKVKQQYDSRVAVAQGTKASTDTIQKFAKENNLSFTSGDIDTLLKDPNKAQGMIRQKQTNFIERERASLAGKNLDQEGIASFQKLISAQEQSYQGKENIQKIQELNQTLNHNASMTDKSVTAINKNAEDTRRLAQINEQHLRGDGAMANGFQDYAAGAASRTEDFAYQMGQLIPQTFSQNMSNAMMKLVREGGDFGDVMMEAAMGMLDTINQKFMDNFMDQVFSSFYKPETPEEIEVGKFEFANTQVANFANSLEGAAARINAAFNLSKDATAEQLRVTNPNLATEGAVKAVDSQGKAFDSSGKPTKAPEGHLKAPDPAIEHMSQAAVQAAPKLNALSTGLSTAYRACNQFAANMSAISVSTKDAYGGGPIRRNTGGRVPAMLTDGEYVLNRSAARRLGGANLSMLNSGKVPASMKRQQMRAFNGERAKEGAAEGAKAGLQAAGMAGGTYLFGKLFEKDKKPEWEQRPDDFFQKNQTWKNRNMSKRFMLNNSRVKGEIDKGRAAKQKETQDWIDMQNKRQALGRQVVTMVGNIATSAIGGGLTGADGSFAGLANEGYGGSTPLMDTWFPKKQGGGIPGSSTALRRNSGGPVSGSPGIDRVPAMLSEGEYVINARAARSIGVGNLEKINAGKFNQGGLVGETTGPESSSPTGGSTNNINITVNVTGSKVSETENKSGDNTEAGDKQKGADQMSKRIKQEVITIIKEENRPGGLLR